MQTVNRNSFSFGSKAENLARLSSCKDFNIPPFYYFTFAEWQRKKTELLQTIGQELFNGAKVAVRSSCLREDSETCSCAGAYLSLLDIDSDDPIALEDAIRKVFASYGSEEAGDQVLIQAMVQNPVLTGVIMTRSLQDGSHYYVINYDDDSGKTDTITSGKNISKTVFVYRNARDDDFDSARLRKIVQLARQVEDFCGKDGLDIEFSLDDKNELHLLQARPICAASHWSDSSDAVYDYIANVADFVSRHTARQPNLYGGRSILGIMPDWNPAEMIGILPRHLDASLYRALITSRVWATAREKMGYNPVHSTELMLLLAGHPYIDIRASFNSFLPADLDAVTAEALVSAWLEYLAAHPQFHDKVEFEVAQTCLDFCFEQNMRERYDDLLTSSRLRAFRESLRSLTARALDESGTLNWALERIRELNARHASRSLFESRHDINQLDNLLDECRKYGTLPFSILARHAFIAESLLKTAATRGALSPERLRQFKKSIRTVSGDLAADFQDVHRGARSSRSFLEKYGHLRPGSYDILSPRYADRDDLFNGVWSMKTVAESAEPFQLSETEKRDMNNLLAEAGLPYDAGQLLSYATKAIAGRETGKFVFSRNLSDALETIAGWANSIGLSREEAAYIPIENIIRESFSVGIETPAARLREMAGKNRLEFAKWRPIKLGYLIRSERDIYVVPQHRSAPNFIGSSSLRAPGIKLSADSPCDTSLAGKIVLIENADPGFDWIFTRGLAGLITKFGGANSHMASRCAEYGLPAAIGVGEHLFEQLQGEAPIILDPSNSILAPSVLPC